jgi:hypothetical protein
MSGAPSYPVRAPFAVALVDYPPVGIAAYLRHGGMLLGHGVRRRWLGDKQAIVAAGNRATIEKLARREVKE